MKTHRLVVPLLLLIGSVSLCASASPKLGKYAKAYTGSEGLTVTVVDVVDSGQKRKLVRIEGIESSIDGIVLLHDQVKTHKGYALQTTIKDALFWTLLSTDHRWGGKNILLTLPEDVRKKHRIWYDEKKSKKIDRGAILSQFQKDAASGAIQKIQLYSGSDLKKRTKRVFREAVNEAKRACGAPIGTRIDWGTIKGDHKKKLPLATLCRQAADELTQFCNASESNKSRAKKLVGITCQAGNAQQLTLSKNRLIWKIPTTKPFDKGALSKQIASLIR